MNISRPFVILSAEREDRGPESNADYSAQLLAQLEERGLRPVLVGGHYRGRAERAYLVRLPGNGQAGHALSQIAQLAHRYGQETVLYVDSNRQAALYSPSNGWSLTHVKDLGQWREAPPGRAQALDAYTYHDGRYFIAG